MAKKMDIEVMVDVTEDLGLEASGKVKGLKFLGKASNAALKMVTSEIGKAIAEAMSKSDKVEETKETETVVEEIEPVEGVLE